MKPRIFIGSSKEGLIVAERIKQFFSSDYDCYLWNDNIFKHNQGILDTLLKSASLFDFGLMVFTTDDLSEVRGKLELTPRDNILFEYGLFLGRVGIERAYMICEKSVKIPSDMNGINLAFFEAKKDKTKDGETIPTNSLEKELTILKDNMDEKLRLGYLGLLPSSTIAISYYENFVKLVCESLCSQNGISIGDKTYKSCKLRIVIPSNLDGDIKSRSMVYFAKTHTTTDIPTKHRPYPMYVAISEGDDGSETLNVADMPTVLNGLDKAIDIYFRRGYIGKTTEQQLTEERELQNFVNVLKFLISQDHFAKSVVEIVDEENNSLM